MSHTDAERERSRRFRRKLVGVLEDDESIHSDYADAQTSPTVPHATPSFLEDCPIEETYPSLRTPTRLLREFSNAEEDLEQLLVVVAVFRSTISSILAAIAAAFLLETSVVPMLLYDTILDTSEKLHLHMLRISKALQLAKDDMREVVHFADRILHYLFLLHKSATAMALLAKTASKPLPKLPPEASATADEPGGKAEPVEQGGKAAPYPHVSEASSSDSEHDQLAPTSSDIATLKRGKFGLVRRLLKMPLEVPSLTPSSSTTLVNPSPTPTPTEDISFSFRQSRLYDCRDPDKPDERVNMPLPNVAVCLDATGQVQAASLPALILLLTSYQAVELDMAETFFLSFRLFSSSSDLMDAFEDRWNQRPLDGRELTPSQKRVWDQHTRSVRNCIAHLVLAWLDGYWRHDEDACVEPRVKAFIQGFEEAGVLESVTKSATKALKRASERGAKGQKPTRVRRAHMAALKRDAPPVILQPFKPTLLGEEDYVLTVAHFMLPAACERFAAQLTSIAHGYFLQIDPEDVVGRWISTAAAPSSGDSDWTNLERFEERLMHYISEGILIEEERSERVKLIEFWLEAATVCIDLRNFSAAFTIFNALIFPPVQRLWRTILEISIPSKERYRRLDNILNGAGQFAVYRQALAAHDLPTVPILSVLREDAISTNEIWGMVVSDGENLINLDAIHRLNNIIQFMESCFVGYKIDEFFNLSESITAELNRRTSFYDYPTYVERSLFVEPAGPTHVENAPMWLQTAEGSVDGEFTLRTLPDPATTPIVKHKKSFAGSLVGRLHKIIDVHSRLNHVA
ncbi:ras guanine nucleotide exchange factor domain-containing protein [Mycena amicta]|nr:ras guanine nucleotide exchange factor domain-containing protein [Mycena amicta]